MKMRQNQSVRLAASVGLVAHFLCWAPSWCGDGFLRCLALEDLETSVALEKESTSTNSSHSTSSEKHFLNSFISHECTANPLVNWNASNLKEVIDAWKFNMTEQEQLVQFQHRISDIIHWKNDAAEAARFLKEHLFDLDKAERFFRDMIEWRERNDIDDFMHDYNEPPTVFQYAPIFLLKGLDKEQDPIFVQRLGRIDGGGLYHSLGGPAMSHAFRFVSELQTSRTCGIRDDWQWQIRYYEPLVGRRMTQLTILVDLDGLSVRLLRPALLGIVQEGARVAQDYYPGLAKRVIIIRAPKVFQMAWKIAKHFYDPRVHNKFIFAEQDEYLDILSEYMDLDVLPSVIYENGHGQPMPNSWFEKIHMEGGTIPALHLKKNQRRKHKQSSNSEENEVEPDELDTCLESVTTDTPSFPSPMKTDEETIH